MGGPVQEKIRVGVVMGGMSSEREVSLESGRNIVSKLSRTRFDVTPVFMDGKGALWEIPIKLLMRNSTKDIEDDLEEEAVPIPYEALKAKIDVAFIGLHGKYGEDGCFQGLLELLKIPYTGSGVLASALGMDKLACRQLLSADNIDVPQTLPVFRKEWCGDNEDSLVATIAERIGFPCIVKPVREGCSTGVRKVLDETALIEAIDNALLWDDTALVEEFISGVEVTCGVLGRDLPYALSPSETIATCDILTLEDKFLYGQGENKTPARLPGEILEKIKEVATKAFVALDLKCYARIDMFVKGDGRILVLEANTLPGMTPSTVLFHQAAASGIDQSDLMERIVDCALGVHADKRGPL